MNFATFVAKFLAMTLIYLAVAGCGRASEDLAEQAEKAERNGDLEGAKQLYDKAIEENPDSAELYWQRGRILLSKQSRQNAIKDFDKVLELEPKHASARIARARLFLEDSQFAEAIGGFSRCIEHKVGRESALLGRSEAYYADLQYENALADLTAVIELAGPKPDFYFKRGRVHLAARDYKQAELDFTTAIDAEENHAHAYWNRSIARKRLGKIELARIDRDKATALDRSLEVAKTLIGKNLTEGLFGKDGGIPTLELKD